MWRPTTFHVSLDSAQWTLTTALLRGAVATPVLGRLGAGPHRRARILATPAISVVGGTLTVFPRLLALLLVGRTAQGVGLGLTALMMGVVRDHSPERRITATIALISVVSIIGAGAGYPLAGLLTQFGGVRAAHGLGLFVTAIAFLAAWRSMFVVGLVLVPFCVLGFGAVTPTPRARMRIDAPLLLVGSAVLGGYGSRPLCGGRSNLAELFVARGVLGFGVGSFAAAMPGLILAVTPRGRRRAPGASTTWSAAAGTPWAAPRVAGRGRPPSSRAMAPTPRRRWSAWARWPSGPWPRTRPCPPLARDRPIEGPAGGTRRTATP
ncbi:MFS transporter [Streptomyces sp. RTGN2]|uniref:MFS transporter n=1 Tax=Streptomyces sp. RTGN2 TaxID=3016525 RepID=UPI0025521D08|nr:MFS transporter [Streptomyces sp. RTGN2]